ncbi:hypothetical protein AV530_005708 [Patagioenas fasciata monilis]|uniref:DUF4817 domain-containing protein n=1 Tax=Patagioenas fasciata monilis TaxID=372326 RepID=A0A1V4JMC8_PATFA|nr:hypothetical protein AV530_005708 [Patagioenas fasciata monilis]
MAHTPVYLPGVGLAKKVAFLLLQWCPDSCAAGEWTARAQEFTRKYRPVGCTKVKSTMRSFKTYSPDSPQEAHIFHEVLCHHLVIRHGLEE